MFCFICSCFGGLGEGGGGKGDPQSEHCLHAEFLERKVSEAKSKECLSLEGAECSADPLELPLCSLKRKASQPPEVVKHHNCLCPLKRKAPQPHVSTEA